MEIIKNNIEEMMKEMNYVYEEDGYPDNQINTLYNYFNFLDKYEDKIIGTKKVSLEIILYSKYYWFSRFLDRYHEVYGPDGGMEQQKSMIFDEIDQRVKNPDWEFVDKLYYGKV